MYLDLTDDQRALRDELRRYFAEELFTPELTKELDETEAGGPEYHKALKKLGADGWLGTGWPKAYGGQDRPPIEQFIFFDEVQRAQFPIPFLTLNTVGPTLMRFGSEAQRERFLPKILAGEIHFAIGYTEPSAGTDLASLSTKAVRDGDEWVINGQKIFTSAAPYADYVWLACRTDQDAAKHAGISIIMVPTDAVGYSQTEIHTLGESITSATYYEDVRVPYDNLVGPLNGGWKLITTQLNHERVALFAVGPLIWMMEDVAQWARDTAAPEGGRVVDRGWVQLNLAKVEADLEVLKLMNWRQAWTIGARGDLHPAEASAVKVFGSEMYVANYRRLLEITGPTGALMYGAAGSILRGRLEMMYRSMIVLTFGGGTNEVQRDIIAMAGLRMPRTKR